MPRAAKPAEPEQVAEETPQEAEAPEEVASWRVLSRVMYTLDGNEYFAGPGETIDGAAAAQVDPDSIEPV